MTAPLPVAQHGAVLAGIKTPAQQLADLQKAWDEGR